MATLQNIICRLLETRKQHSLFLYVLFTCNYIFQIGIFIYKLPAPHYPQCQTRARLFHEASSLAYLVSSCRKLITLAHLQPHSVLGLPGHLSSPWFWLSSVALMKWVRGNSMSLQPGLIFVIALWLWCSASARLTGCPEGTMKIHMQQRLTAEDTPEHPRTVSNTGCRWKPWRCPGEAALDFTQLFRVWYAQGHHSAGLAGLILSKNKNRSLGRNRIQKQAQMHTEYSTQ